MSPPRSDRKAAPSQWVSAHGDALYSYALRRLGNATEAEDAVQECLVAALGAARPFRGDSAERTWLTGILRHKVLDALRARYRRKEHTADLSAAASGPHEDFSDGFWRVHQQGLSASIDPSGDAMERAEFARRVARAVDGLPEPMRAVLVLREVDGLGTAELGEALGVSASQVWTLVHRAKARLRRELGGEGEES
ncbi:MAG: RNA polymerase sigma factor [Phycisphaerales bacterium JB060]